VAVEKNLQIAELQLEEEEIVVQIGTKEIGKDLGLDQAEEEKEKMKNEEEVVGVDRVIKIQGKEEPGLALVAQVDHLAVVQVAQAQVEALLRAQIRLDQDQEAKKIQEKSLKKSNLSRENLSLNYRTQK